MAVRMVVVAGLAIAMATPARADQTAGWGAYGGDPGGTRYSALTQITRGNVARLKLAWSMRTGDFQHQDGSQKGPAVSCSRCHQTGYKFEATPILADGRLYVSTPFNRRAPNGYGSHGRCTSNAQDLRSGPFADGSSRRND